MSKYAKILHEVVLPKLLEDERFKDALADAVREIPIVELSEISTALPERKSLTIGTLPKASQNHLGNMITEMRVTLIEAVTKANQ